MSRARTQAQHEPQPQPAAAPSHRMSLSQVVERLTERRGASSSVTVKMSAQGVLMPEVTVAAGEDAATVDTMVTQAIDAFTRIVAAALEQKGGDAK